MNALLEKLQGFIASKTGYISLSREDALTVLEENSTVLTDAEACEIDEVILMLYSRAAGDRTVQITTEVDQKVTRARNLLVPKAARGQEETNVK